MADGRGRSLATRITPGQAADTKQLVAAARFGPLPAPRPAGTYLARREAKAFDRLLTGDLEPAEYRALMAAVAAQDAVARPLRVPR